MQTLTVQECRGLTELADAKLISFCNYWTHHPNNAHRYEKYATTLLQALLHIRFECVDSILPSDLQSWPLRFTARIDYFKSLAYLYDQEFNLDEYLLFLRFILRNIEPTCSGILNRFQLDEINFVIEELKQYGNSQRARDLVLVAEKEYAFLNEDCEKSYFPNCYFDYLKNDIERILNQDLYSGTIRYAFFEALRSGCPNYSNVDAKWLDEMSEKLETSRCRSWPEEEWCSNSILFLQELMNDIFFAANDIAEEPRELPLKFRKGISLLVRRTEADFLISRINAIYQELRGFEENESTPDWVMNCKSDIEELCLNAEFLAMPMTIQREHFALF